MTLVGSHKLMKNNFVKDYHTITRWCDLDYFPSVFRLLETKENFSERIRNSSVIVSVYHNV